MVSHKNYNLDAKWGICHFLTSKLIACFIDGFTSKKKSQSIAQLLDGSEHIYWILDLENEVHSIWVIWTSSLQECQGRGGPGLGRAKVRVGPGSGDPCSSFFGVAHARALWRVQRLLGVFRLPRAIPLKLHLVKLCPLHHPMTRIRQHMRSLTCIRVNQSHAPNGTQIVVRFQPWNCWGLSWEIDVGPPIFTLLQSEMSKDGVKNMPVWSTPHAYTMHLVKIKVWIEVVRLELS
jgi:hypothetical protein